MAEETSKKTPRRRKVAKKPETVRERGVKASAAKARQPRRKKLTSGASKPVKKTGSLLRTSLSVHEHKDHNKLMSFLTKHRSPVPSYLRGALFEIRNVTWPSFKEAMRLTTAVIIFAVGFALLVSGLDWLLDKAFQEVILNESQNIKDWFNDLY